MKTATSLASVCERRVKLKICGVKNGEDIAALSSLGVDYIGIIVEVKRSLRSLDRSAAVKLAITSHVPVVFVVSNPDFYLLEELARSSPHAIQFHGNESLNFLKEVKEKFSCEVWKAVELSSNPQEIKKAKNCVNFDFSTDAVDRYVLDRPKTSKGGVPLGKWKKAKKLLNKPFFLAGSITPQNVKTIIQEIMPFGIDISRGVEAYAGKKNLLDVHEVLVSLAK